MGPRSSEISGPHSNRLGNFDSCDVDVKLCFARGYSVLDSSKAFVADMGYHKTPKYVLWPNTLEMKTWSCYSLLPVSGKQGYLLYYHSVASLSAHFTRNAISHGPSDLM